MNATFYKRVRRNDRIAHWIINIGGIGIIAVVIGMLVQIASVALPLFSASKLIRPDRTNLQAQDGFAMLGPSDAWTMPLADELREGLLAVTLDDYFETGAVILSDGTVVVVRVDTGEELKRMPVAHPEGGEAELLRVTESSPLRYDYLWKDGALSRIRIKSGPQFNEEGERTIITRLETEASWPAVSPPGDFVLTGGGTRVDLYADGRVRTLAVEREEDFLGNVTVTRSEGEWTGTISGRILTAALNKGGDWLVAGTEEGLLLGWNLSDPANPRVSDKVSAGGDGIAVTAVDFVLGDQSVVVGDAQGRVASWMKVRSSDQGNDRVLRLIHPLPSLPSAVQGFVAAARNKSMMAYDDQGTLLAFHLTSERRLFERRLGAVVQHAGWSQRGDALVVQDAEDTLHLWEVHNPHPEVSFRTLFGDVWYEGYDEPNQVWQSSAATVDSEPKLSLTPLIFGTFKATFYAMFFAVPIGVLGALYTSQFMRPNLRNRVKPIIEIMAAVPSVVVGFLAGLWLAPLLEDYVPGIFAASVGLPLIFWLTVILWRQARHLPLVRQLENGTEFLAMLPVVVIAVLVSVGLGLGFENVICDGNYRQWVFDTFELRVDQRNSIIIALALGFAVIPIVFTMSEDALSSVPKNLTAASLALGASRWQTAWSVVLPSASPGIFAAIMIGFGRAVGETMIVLMATGNTPIMDWSIFNGMRTLSANIAVEIPEAPHGGTLYRVLFLSAVLLFIMTFILNTGAEIIRQRLRKKYGNY